MDWGFVMGNELRPAAVVVTAELMLAVRIEDVVEKQGGQALIAGSADEFLAAMDGHAPVMALVDLATPGDVAAAIARCKLRPHTRQTPIYAFGSHVNVAALQAARRAGADHAWARSKMMEQLAEVVGRHMRPPVRFPAGWDDRLSELARRGLEEFNRGEYFEQHELLEQAWLAEERPIREMYQGILQVGVAFFQIQQGNWPGAVKMFRRGLPRLRGLPDMCQGVNVAKFRRQAEEVHAAISELGPQRMGEFDLGRLPRIEYAE